MPFRVSRAALWSGRTAMVLLGRGRGEALATLGGFGLWLRLGRLLDFFSAFIFASHVCKCATKMRLEESLQGELADIFRCRFLICYSKTTIGVPKATTLKC
jgi:hypothetical protein